MRIPRNYNQVTVEEYQSLYPILQKPELNEDDWAFIISFFSGKTVDQVNELDLKFLKYIIKTLSFLLYPPQPTVKNSLFKSGLLKAVRFSPRPKKFLRLGGKIFMASGGVMQINTGRLREIKTTMSMNETVNVLHELCALTYEENTKKGFGFNFKYIKNNRPENAEIFKKAPMSIAYQSVFFCSEVLQNWMLNTPDYLESETLIANRMKEIKQELHLNNIGSFGLGKQH